MRSAELPLVFRNPPGWPQPSADWVAVHQGWQPPAGWRPSSTAPAAPPAWRFWEPNTPVWDAYVGPARERVLVWLWVSIGVGLLGLIVSLVGAASGGRYILFWGAILWPIISLIRLPFRLRDIREIAMYQIRKTSESLRAEYEQSRYDAFVRGSDR